MFCPKSSHDLEFDSGIPAFSHVRPRREPKLSAEVALEDASRRKDRLRFSWGLGVVTVHRGSMQREQSQ